MKLKYTITTLAAASFALLSSCGDKKETHSDNDGHDHGDHAGHDHAEGEHDEHEGHDHAQGDHDDHSGHDHIKAGPNKGRMISTVTPQAEFFVQDNGKVKITFFDKEMNVVAPSGQSVSVVSGERISPVELTFTAEGDALVSTEALPAGNNFPTIVAIKSNADAKEVVTRLTLNLSDCSSCSNQEYACECHH